MKLIPFDAAKFRLGEVAVCGSLRCKYIKDTKNGRIAIECDDGSVCDVTEAQLIRDFKLESEPEYVPLTMDDLLAMPQLPLVRAKGSQGAEVIVQLAHGCLFTGLNSLPSTYKWLDENCEMLVNGKWVPMRKEKP